MPGDTEIEDYEPDDRGWGVVVGRLMPKPEHEDDAPKDSQSSQSEDE
jgi:hypothetical protein